MFGEGMPWHIILVFMLIGFLMGINSGKKDQKKRESDLEA